MFDSEESKTIYIGGWVVS